MILLYWRLSCWHPCVDIAHHGKDQAAIALGTRREVETASDAKVQRYDFQHPIEPSTIAQMRIVMPRLVRHIIKPPGAYRQFRDLAQKNGLQLIDKIQKEPRNPLALQEIFTNIDDTVGIHYVEDGMAELPYIQISGPRLDDYSRIITQNLPVYSEDELFAAWDAANSLDEKIDAILRLGITADAPPADRYLHRIRQGLEDPAPEVRSATLVAFSYHPRDELKAVVERIRDEDPDDDARQRAQVILDTWLNARLSDLA